MVDERCAIHDIYASAQEQRWAEQERKNEALFRSMSNLTDSIRQLDTRIAYATGAVAVIVFAAPFIWKMIASVLGVQL